MFCFTSLFLFLPWFGLFGRLSFVGALLFDGLVVHRLERMQQLFRVDHALGKLFCDLVLVRHVFHNNGGILELVGGLLMVGHSSHKHARDRRGYQLMGWHRGLFGYVGIEPGRYKPRIRGRRKQPYKTMAVGMVMYFVANVGEMDLTVG